MYKTIIARIYSVLKTIPSVKAVYPYPLKGLAKTHPAVIFVPDTIENVYSSNTENLKKYKFKIWIEVSLAGTTEEKVFTDILPNTVDKVIEQFDKDWSHNIGGHTAWLVIDSGLWGMTEENSSKVAWAELSLTYQVSNDV